MPGFPIDGDKYYFEWCLWQDIDDTLNYRILQNLCNGGLAWVVWLPNKVATIRHQHVYTVTPKYTLVRLTNYPGMHTCYAYIQSSTDRVSWSVCTKKLSSEIVALSLLKNWRWHKTLGIPGCHGHLHYSTNSLLQLLHTIIFIISNTLKVQTFARVFHQLNALPVLMAAIFVPKKPHSTNVKANWTVMKVLGAIIT